LFVTIRIYVITDKTSNAIRSWVACRFSRYQWESLEKRFKDPTHHGCWVLDGCHLAGTPL
jgi:hypothetical protein